MSAATYYKAVRPDLTDFRTGTVRYDIGTTVEHPTTRAFGDMVRDAPSTYLSVATVPTDCTGMRWPCRLLAVEGVGRPLRAEGLPNKRCFRAVRVIEELPAHEVFGPYGAEVVALVDRSRTLTAAEARRIRAAWDAAGAAAWDAAGDAAGALVVRDLITPEQFDTLYGPWASVIGGRL